MQRNKLGVLCAILFTGSHTPGIAAESSGWHAVRDQDPLSQKTMCLLESEMQMVHDGQTKTPIRIVFNGQVFIVTTRSNIDLTYPDVGLSVDALPMHPIDRLHKATHAVFESNAEKLRLQFSKGLKAKVALGFWPTWPKTETKVATYSLLGFQTAYAAFLKCQNAK